MIPRKVLVNQDNTATFVCLKCGFRKTLNVFRYIGKEITKQYRYRCSSCGDLFTVLLERRKFFRKEVAIPGFFTVNNQKEKIAMKVIDLSRAGLRIELSREAALKIGDHLTVEFHLDNKPRTFIRKDVVVRDVCGLQAGTEFCSRDTKNPIDRAYEIAIGFYVFKK